MCKKCRVHKKYWLHIADDWTEEERKEMLEYLKSSEPRWPEWLSKAVDSLPEEMKANE
jgi:hypothetical protein